MFVKVIIYILVGLGVFFALPSTVYTFMFFGIFHRRRSIMLENDNLENTQYYPYADRLKKDILQARGLPFEEVKLKAQDGALLYGRYYEASSDKAVILVHGYQSNGFNNFSSAMLDFLNKGYNVLLIDQRAHGGSGGKFTAMGRKEKDDLLLWIAYLDAKTEIRSIVVYGISMGAATVGYASERITSCKVKGLIMEAGFPCFYDELTDGLGNVFMKRAALNCMYLTAKAVLKIDIKESTERSLANNKIPTLFLHGDADKEVPAVFTERNFTACASVKERITVEGAGHTLCYLTGGESLRSRIYGFIEDCIGKKQEKEE